METEKIVNAGEFSPGLDPSKFSTDELKAFHLRLHLMYPKEAGSQTAIPGWSLEDVVNLHARIVDDLFERGVTHPPPPDNGLDGASDDFERHEDENPSWTTPRPVKKLDDPFMRIPPEREAPFRYVVQQHWRGESMHSDFRTEVEPGKLLIGWTLNTQNPGVVKEPVITLDQAQNWMNRIDELSKINWKTGEWDKHEKIGANSPVTVEILSETKAPEPWEWLDVEGATPKTEEGEAPSAGATRQFPGVYQIVDKGVMEYGTQKPRYHEYFVRGRAFNYRLMFRKLQIGDASAQGTEQWLCIKPDDQTPYVIGQEALSKGWIPPAGFSSLPASVQSQIPEQYRYWDNKSADKVKTIRDLLIEAIKSGEVKIDYGALPTKKSVSKAQVRIYLPIQKVESDKRLVTGIVLEPDKVDAQNDTVTCETIERAAHRFVSRYNRDTQIGLMHSIFGENGLELVESFIVPNDMTIGGSKVTKGTWVMTVKVLNDDVWKRVKNGEITGFSIGGLATVSS